MKLAVTITMKTKRKDVDRGHPETLAAGRPERFAAGGSGGGQLDRLTALHFKQHHQRGQDEDGDEEEKVVADDRTDDRHLLTRRGKNSVLRELVQAGDDKLRGDQEKNRGGDLKEFLQVDLDAALDEHHAEQYGNDNTQDRADETHQFTRVQRDGGEDEDGFDALAQDHQKDEREQTNPRIAAGEQADLAFDLAFELASGFHHEDDHGDDEHGGDQHDPAFEDVFIPFESGEHDGDGD